MFAQTPSHRDTAHGSQTNYSSHFYSFPYYNQGHTSQPAFTTAEDYQNVWDPWEEYDSRQFENQTELTYSHHENVLHQETINNHISNHQVEYQSNDHNHISYESSNSHHHFSTSVEHHHKDNQVSFSRCQSSESSTTHSVPSHNHFAESHNHYSHDVEIHSHNNEQKVLESHNTNACTDANHCHYSHPQIPFQGYSPPQQVFQMTKPPPPNEPSPRLLITTATVSDDKSLQCTKEDTHDVSIVLNSLRIRFFLFTYHCNSC